MTSVSELYPALISAFPIILKTYERNIPNSDFLRNAFKKLGSNLVIALQREDVSLLVKTHMKESLHKDFIDEVASYLHNKSEDIEKPVNANLFHLATITFSSALLQPDVQELIMKYMNQDSDHNGTVKSYIDMIFKESKVILDMEVTPKCKFLMDMADYILHSTSSKIVGKEV